MIEIYNEISETGLDTNSTSTKTAGTDVSTCEEATFYVIAATGAHTTHVVTLQFSHEDVDASYQDSEHTLTGVGCKHVSNIQSVAWMRLKVTTVESGTSTCDMAIDPSRDVRRFCR